MATCNGISHFDHSLYSTLAMFKSYPIILVILIIWGTCANALNILGAFTHHGKSHFDVFEPIMLKLAERGHKVTILSHFDNPSEPKNLQYLKFSTNSTPAIESIPVTDAEDYFGPGRLMTLLHESCGDDFKSETVIDLIKSEAHFGLVIVEAFISDCFISLGHRFGAPVIQISSSVLIPMFNDRLGQPNNPSYINNFLNVPKYNMNFWHRLQNTLMTVSVPPVFEYLMTAPQKQYIKDVFGSDAPCYNSMVNNISLMLINTHFTLNGAVPNVPQVIEVGGIHIGKIKKLPNVSKINVYYFLW